MPKRTKPRSGSLQYWPRKRAKRIYPRVSSWASIPSSQKIEPLGFAGFKAGMTHAQCVEKGKTIIRPITIIDAPPLLVCGIRFYKEGEHGLMVAGEKWIKLSKDLQRKLGPKRGTSDMKDKAICEVRLIVATQPMKSGMHKKKPDIFELGVGGDNINKKTEYAESLLGKELSVKDIFKQGEYIDVSAVTKGHGFTGPVKRFGIKIQTRKNEQHHRHVGSIGSVVPRHVDWRIPAAGQYGFFNRTEYNKRIMLIGDDPSKVNPKGGFVGYGSVRSHFIAVEGSVPGHRKRLVMLRKAIRKKGPRPVDVRSISLESKQGK